MLALGYLFIWWVVERVQTTYDVQLARVQVYDISRMARPPPSLALLIQIQRFVMHPRLPHPTPPSRFTDRLSLWMHYILILIRINYFGLYVGLIFFREGVE
ncbi:hypothetical protein EDB19DRAFT_2038693 [Suillus lakei]|nr:hypothetical protein EDB19DRAFT_2038693 [Suillus lakei]